MIDENVTIRRKIHFSMQRKGRREIRSGSRPVPQKAPDGRIPRISRLMALAIHFDRLIHSGAVADQADLARLGHVTRARVTQIMNLLHLAPDIQEEILFLPRITTGRDLISERCLRAVAGHIEWRRQRRLWYDVRRGRRP